MQMPDVNILIHAWRQESPDHERAQQWLEDTVSAPDGLGLVDQVAAGAIRILTKQIPGLGVKTDDVLAHVDELRASSGVRIVRPGPKHWSIFSGLCHEFKATGNQVPDCYLAAFAIENDATWVSRDTFFASVPGLQWMDLPGD